MLATRRGSAHYPSMLEDVDARRPTEVELINGALVREAREHGVDAPLQTALYRLVKAREARTWRRVVSVCVVGCGAVGSLFAANLAQLDDVEVWAYDLDARARRRDQPGRAAPLRRRRRRRPCCARPQTPRSCRRATSGSSRRRRCTPTRAIAATARRVRRRRRRVRAERHRQRGGDRRATSPRVIRGTTFPAGRLLGPGHVQWDVKGDTTFGPFEPRPAGARRGRAPGRGVHARRDADRGRGGRARAAVAEGDLQRVDEPARRAHRSHARAGLRATRTCARS